MSFFDRLGNLGRGAIKNALSGTEPEPADPLARQLERLHKAYTEGILTEAEYQAKRTALLGGTASSAPSRPAPQATAPRTPITPPERSPSAAPGEPDEERPEDKPLKRTL